MTAEKTLVAVERDELATRLQHTAGFGQCPIRSGRSVGRPKNGLEHGSHLLSPWIVLGQRAPEIGEHPESACGKSPLPTEPAGTTLEANQSKGACDVEE